MRKKISVITAIFGSYDEVPPIPRGFAEAILVSDVKIESDWENRVITTDLPPRLSSKIPKFRPDLFTTYSSSVWVDASMRDSEDWLYKASLKKLLNNDLVFFKHPQRSCILEEMLASLELDKYLGEPLVEQVHFYQTQGFKDDIGLWAGGVIARNHTLKNKVMGDAWLEENKNWSTQDQLSLPYIAWKTKTKIATFEENQYTGPLKWIKHKGEDWESLMARINKTSKILQKTKTLMLLIKTKRFSAILTVLIRSIFKFRS